MYITSETYSVIKTTTLSTHKLHDEHSLL